MPNHSCSIYISTPTLVSCTSLLFASCVLLSYFASFFLPFYFIQEHIKYLSSSFHLDMEFNKFRIRSYEAQSADRAQVENLERKCEVGPSESVFLFTDTMGDPICRIRNSPMYMMLVYTITITHH